MAKQEKVKKEKAKKEKKTKGKPEPKAPGSAKLGNGKDSPSIDRSQLTPDQLAKVQLEEAIKESNDPASKLRKLKSPLSVGGCLLNLLALIVLTFGLVFLIAFFMVDKFNFGTVFMDMMDQFGITQFFQTIGNWFQGLFK